MQTKIDRYNSRMIRNVVPAFICERFANGDRSGRFHGVALFVDIPGFTAMTEELMGHGPHGAEVLAAIVRTIFDLLGKPVYEQGGFIATIAGDGFTALFPGEGEDVACRGLAAAHEMQRQMVVNARQTTPYGYFDASVKVGLALGEVGWGIVEAVDGSRACYYFRGETITDCAAAGQLANRGEIILNRKFRDRIRDWLVVEPAGGYFRLAAITRSLPAPQAIVPYDPDPRIMTRFFPGDLLGMSVSGEFRQTVSLFIGLPSLRAERQLRIFVQTIFTLQEHYGGLLNRLDFSDKGVHLVLFWGAPISHENDIERALNFVLALQAQTSIPLHAGITYRMAHTGFVGSALREDYTAYGRGVNLAARLMMAAPRSEVWMDESLARRARQRFEVEYEGHVAFKGFEYEQPVYVLMERKDAPERFYKGELVGRQRELEQMEEFVKPLWKGKRAGAMVILGEAGIGKSRFMHAFQASEQFAQREALWALCQADPILRQPLNPFRYWLRRYFAQSEGLAEARNKRNFNRKLDGLINQLADRSLAQELDRSRSFLGALVDLRWPDSLYEQLDPQGRFENTFTALSTLFLAESKRQPVIIQ
ncbi:MAG TPA: adenylate/guanylate cyclase domain-containing protein, partial [Anaerolineae bacterium]|nr:adenylate/guanylate cyclase domain-containing protein [Anaerolineae bacterium]